MAVYVALLRGVNVGGKGKVAMADLRALFESLGYDGVTTYIQSGNVVFNAKRCSAAAVLTAIERGIDEQLGLSVSVVVRTPSELADVVARNPFAKVRPELAKQLHVGFLAQATSARARKELDPQRSPPDEFVVDGREIYLRTPNGIGRSKLTNSYFESKLETRVTMRNWTTVTKLLDLAQAQRTAS